MAYHIFTTRKVILTTEMNDTETNMMIDWQKQTDLQAKTDDLYDTYAGLAEANDDGALTQAQQLAFSRDLTKLSNDEDKLEREIQLLETKYSEKSQELTKVEEQEKTAIEQDEPNYAGAGGNK